MSRRSRYNAARHRRMLSFQVAERLDQLLESRSFVTPFAAAAALAITAGPALGPAAIMHAIGGGMMP